VPTLDERVREFALSLPGAVEEYPWGERVAKAGRKVFVFLGPEGSQLMTVKLRESHGHAMASTARRRPGMGWGGPDGSTCRCERTA
jgi:hypothetical protein